MGRKKKGRRYSRKKKGLLAGIGIVGGLGALKTAGYLLTKNINQADGYEEPVKELQRGNFIGAGISALNNVDGAIRNPMESGVALMVAGPVIGMIAGLMGVAIPRALKKFIGG